MRPLTPRQLEVARLIADGLTNDEVADRLGIAPRTARAHSDAIRAALGVRLRRNIPQVLRQQGLI